LEALQRQRRGQVRVANPLERDDAVEAHLARAPDHAHAAATKHFEQFVVAEAARKKLGRTCEGGGLLATNRSAELLPGPLKTGEFVPSGSSALVCPAGVWSIGMKGSRRGLVTPTVAEPPGRLRKEPARKGGRQTFDRRNTNGP
jgi:hypothetical protein